MTGRRKTSNQQLRTRKDLLLAASRLMKEGRKPTMDEVAEEAMVSRATAFRHFGRIDALLVEAPVDAAVGDPAALFTPDDRDDPATRLDKAETALHEIVYRNEAQLRVMLAHSISRDLSDDDVPRRQNRRLPLIEAAAGPLRQELDDDAYMRLCAALALVFGTEAMIVFRDILRVDEKTAREVKSWTIRALVRAALESSGNQEASRSRTPDDAPS